MQLFNESFLQEFIGNSDRNEVARHWFTSEIVAQFLKIRILARNGNACMRVQVLGCNAGNSNNKISFFKLPSHCIYSIISEVRFSFQPSW